MAVFSRMLCPCPWGWDTEQAPLFFRDPGQTAPALLLWVPVKLLTREPDLLIQCSRRQAFVPEAHLTQDSLHQRTCLSGRNSMAAQKVLCHEAHSRKSPGVNNTQLNNEQLQWQDDKDRFPCATTKPPKRIHTHLAISYPIVTTKTTKMATQSQMYKFAVRTKAAINIPRSQ